MNKKNRFHLTAEIKKVTPRSIAIELAHFCMECFETTSSKLVVLERNPEEERAMHAQDSKHRCP